MPAGQLPGMNVFQVMAQAPLDFANLAVRQMGDLASIANLGVQRLGAELAVPPALPQGLPDLSQFSAGLPQLPQGLPQFPGIGAVQQAAPAMVAAQNMGFGAPYTPAPRLII